jgi:F5/8 type C domain
MPVVVTGSPTCYMYSVSAPSGALPGPLEGVGAVLTRISTHAFGRGARSLPARGTALGWLPIVLLVVAAGVRALRFAAPFLTPYEWDEAATGVWGIQVLAGTFPVYFLGNEYQGVPGAYPLAAWFALAGSSHQALDAFAYIVGLALLWTGWLVVRRFLAPEAAIAALLVLIAPPLPLASRSLNGGLDYPMLLVLGQVFLLGTHSVLYGRVPLRRALLGLGVLAGLGWWDSPLFAVYLAPFVWLAFRHGLARRRATAWFAGGALLGSLPVWLYEALYFPSTRHVTYAGGSTPVNPILVRATTVFGTHVPDLLGVPEHGLLRSGTLAVSASLLLLGLAVAFWRDRAELRWVLALGGSRGRGRAILWIVLAANLVVVVATPQGAVGSRYLHPLYTVLPCFTGIALAWLWCQRRSIAVVSAAALIGIHAWHNWAHGPGGTPSAQWRWRPITRGLEPLVTWLESRGIHHAYWASRGLPPSYEMTYLAAGRVIFADPWRELALPYARAVDASEAPPFVAPDESDEVEELRGTLPALGLEVRETRVGRHIVFQTDAQARSAFLPLPPDGWRVSAEPYGDEITTLTDRDAATGWTTRRGQQPGQQIVVDLRRETLVTRVDLLSVDWQEVPAGFRIDVSRDGSRWEGVLSVPRYWGPFFFAGHHAMLKVRHGRVQAVFPPITTRWLRIVQTGTVPHRPWRARELFVYAPGLRAGDDGPPIAALLGDRRPDFVYADPWLAARVHTRYDGRVRIVESNYYVNNNGRPRPDPRWLEPFRITPGRVMLLGPDADSAAVKATLSARGVPVDTRIRGPYEGLRFTAAEQGARRLDRGGWRATASVNIASAGRALDGKVGTRWTSDGPASPNDYFTVDLGRVQDVSGIRLTPGSLGGPQALQVEGSTDGIAWVGIGPLVWAGALYWTGFELLRNSEEAWVFTFPLVRIRHLRVRPSRLSSTPWIVAEFDCFN